MEEIRARLFRLLKDELDSLAIGHTYNLDRLSEMKQLCHIIVFSHFYEDSSDVTLLRRLGEFYGSV